jgi:hypothetical protein
MKESHDTLRQQSGKLLARTHAIRVYRLWALLRLVPNGADVAKAGGYLIGLANGVYDKGANPCDYDTKADGK